MVSVYVKGQRLDLFKDERVEINLSIKDINDIAKVLTDYTQSFSVPASAANNRLFQHWYEADVDGTFNANLKHDAYLEVNGLPFRYGSVQLLSCTLDKLRPASYSISFFSAGVNLSALFGDDKLSSLDLSEFDHDYTEGAVVEAMRNNSLTSHLYYPLINAEAEMNIGTGNARDLINPFNTISYREFKPAIRLLKVIEAIEAKYDITFSRDFFDRAPFYSLFMWLHREAGALKAFGQIYDVDITDKGTIPTSLATVDTSANTITYDPQVGSKLRSLRLKVTPAAGFEDVPYEVIAYDSGSEVARGQYVGVGNIIYNDAGVNERVMSFAISASQPMSVTTVLRFVENDFVAGDVDVYTAVTAPQTFDVRLVVSEQMPDFKIKDLFASLISQFNLVIVPRSMTDYYIDTVDSWYEKGVAYDVTKYINIDKVTVKRPDVKKSISFLYQKAGAILGEQFRTANEVGYGDLKADYITSGDDLKIETGFENLMFERLQNRDTDELTDIHAGYSIDKNLKPYKGAPFMFYRNGLTEIADDIYIGGEVINGVHHTATDNNVLPEQITSSLNFGDDISTYTYQPVLRGLYYNFWKTYIEDLYNQKNRVLTLPFEGLPMSITQRLKLNDRFVFRDKKYKISSIKIDLTTGKGSAEVFSDFSPPFDSYADTIPLTVDSTMYTVDTTLLTADMTHIHIPVVSYVQNGITPTTYYATDGSEDFEVRVNANTVWSASKVNTGNGTGWFSINRQSGSRSGYIRVSVAAKIGGATRAGIVKVTIGTTDYNVTIIQ